MNTFSNLEKQYQRLFIQLKELLAKSPNLVSQMATVCALLHNKLPHFFWTGFYLLQQEELVVGPYQGFVACQILEKHKGVGWAGILREKTLIVPDVHKFPGHIACDSRSNSEIVVPLFDEKGNVWGVLDVDSKKLNNPYKLNKLKLRYLRDNYFLYFFLFPNNAFPMISIIIFTAAAAVIPE